MQGVVGWYPFNCKFTKKISSSQKNCKSVKIWQNYGYESLVPFFGPPCIWNETTSLCAYVYRHMVDGLCWVLCSSNSSAALVFRYSHTHRISVHINNSRTYQSSKSLLCIATTKALSIVLEVLMAVMRAIAMYIQLWNSGNQSSDITYVNV